MKQELESILSFGAQAVSGEKTIFDQAALRHLDRLMEGNSGYKTTPANPAVLSQELREGTAKNGQSPLAVIVCCSDSRVPPEHIFHAGIGELFIVRNAGNLISDFALGSVEYAVEHLETPGGGHGTHRLRRGRDGADPGTGEGRSGCHFGGDPGRHRRRDRPPSGGAQEHPPRSGYAGPQPYFEGAAPGGQGGVRRRHL